MAASILLFFAVMGGSSVTEWQDDTVCKEVEVYLFVFIEHLCII